MIRRDFIRLTSMLPFLMLTARYTGFNFEAYANTESRKTFSRQWLENYARSLAEKPYDAPKTLLPDNYQSLNYDQYRDIRFRSEQAIWRDDKLPFQLQFFHTGFLYKYPIKMYIVKNGESIDITYSKNLFSFGPLIEEPKPEKNAGFSGFRIHSQLNEKNYFDEFAVFQGASYFRAIAAGQTYGLSARGLAIDTGQARGEEFPVFREFWIEEPKEGTSQIIVHALLDSTSVTGAYSFKLIPNTTTRIEVKKTLFPRRTLNHVGIAPLTSMFFLGPSKTNNFDDFRPRVHDSEGLTILNGKNEWIWRPLTNPRKLQFSAFVDEHPKGFGLAQRSRSFSDYYDFEARYDKRPTLWVETVGQWGEGYVELLEIPTNKEIHDNIVAFWQPREDLLPGKSYSFNYNLHWGWKPPVQKSIAQAVTTRTGRAGAGVSDNTNRLFIVDFKFANVASNIYDQDLSADVSASSGKISKVVLKPNNEIGGRRLSFQYDPQGSEQADLRSVLLWKDRAISETWLYRWET